MQKRTAHNKGTKEDFIKASIEKHGDEFGYDDIVYVDNLTPVEIFCKAHKKLFSQIPKNHKKGGKCPDCIKERYSKLHSKGTEKFIEEAIEKYGDRDNYDKVEYVNNREYVIITCKIHGDYSRKPNEYLKGSICRKCTKKTTKKGYSKYSNKELFKEAGISIHGDITDYSKVGEIDKNSKVELRCLKHDHEYTIGVSAHLGGQKCPICAMENYSLLRTKPKEKFVEEAREVYGDLHDYTDTVYKGHNKEIEVKCKEHDYVFKTLPGNYLAGYGCTKCRVEKTRYRGGHHSTKENYVKLANGRDTLLYLIKCSKEGEEFYKIGKTFRTLKKRFTKSNMPYDYEEVITHTSDAGTIWDLEKNLHKKYKEYKTKVSEIFAGYSECYDTTLPIEEIVNLEVCQKE